MTNTSPPRWQALGIGLEEFEYPYPVEFLPVANDLQSLTMAYMDVPPGSEANGSTVVLMHGKAFGGYYFLNVIEALTTAGYRVVVPDQIGWGKSSKPDIHYSFQLFAANTATLLDHLGVGQVSVLGHSTGGMTATRFTLMNPDRVTHLVLEDPLGLVDYRTGIPPQSDRSRARLLPGVDGASGPLPSLARTEEERGRTSRSGLHGAAAPSYSLVQRGRSDVAQDPR
jgi:pimeloyl-ACP methyl ester carboxylesterase